MNSSFDISRTLLLILTLIIGFILGVLSSFLPWKIFPQQSAQKELVEKQLPVELSILQNPVVGAWRGEVAGKLTAKTDTSITISNDQGQSITIPIDPGAQGTKFINQSSITKGELNSMISLKDIPIGSKLRGDFFFLGKDRILGSSFIVGQ